MAKLTDQEKAVADRLRREIAESRPEFSERLHRRLFHGLQQHRASNGPSPLRKSTAKRASRWAPVAAATCLLLALGVTWQITHVVRVAEPDAPALANGRKAGLGVVVELADRVAVKTDAMVDTAAEAQGWAYLDLDARAVLKTPAARLPFDIISSLLSVQRQDRTRGPAPRTATRAGNRVTQEQVGV